MGQRLSFRRRKRAPVVRFYSSKRSKTEPAPIRHIHHRHPKPPKTFTDIRRIEEGDELPTEEVLCASPTSSGDLFVTLLPILVGTLPEEVAKIVAQYAATPHAWTGTAKILLLGGRYVGKTTLYRRMIQFCGDGFNPKNRLGYRFAICKNIQQSFEELVQGVKGKHFVCDDFQWNDDRGMITEENLGTLLSLWDDKEIRDRFELRASLKLHRVVTELPYFMKHIERITQKDFIPNMEDIFRVYHKTGGICDLRGTFSGNGKFNAYDVGGSRKDRSRWVHCFEDVVVVIFVADISSYDELLLECESVYRLREDLQLFEEVCNNVTMSWNYPSEVILCLNKVDLFEEKLKTSPFDKYYPDFVGDIYDSDQCKLYLYDLFKNIVNREFVTLDRTSEESRNSEPSWRGRDNGVHIFFTNFLDAENCSDLLDAMEDITFDRISAQSRRKSVLGLSDDDIRVKFKDMWENKLV